jgi:DNA-binding transcriptional regulator YhcF (GntR family)
MQFLLDKSQKSALYEQARGQLLAALHAGLVGAGDRLPSMRQLAVRNSINTKTAFSIYRRLNEEGYIDLRQGSGAYVSYIEMPDLEQAYCFSLLKLIKSNFSEAQRLKLSQREYADLVQSFVEKSEPGAVCVAIVECNEEQISVFAREISERLKVRVFPLLLSQLESPDQQTARVLAETDYFVTTDFHLKRVRDLTETKYRKKVLQVRLNPVFMPKIVAATRRGQVLMIVSNTDYFPAFRRTLLDIGTSPTLVERISAVDFTDQARVRASLEQARSVYITPVCDRPVRKMIPAHAKEIKFDSILSPDSIETLEAVIMFHTYQTSPPSRKKLTRLEHFSVQM